MNFDIPTQLYFFPIFLFSGMVREGLYLTQCLLCIIMKALQNKDYRIFEFVLTGYLLFCLTYVIIWLDRLNKIRGLFSMNIVEPIRSENRIKQIRGNLYRQKNPRDYLLFVFGINSGLRIGDILSLKLGDVKDSRGDLKDYLDIKEQKTGKTRKVHF